MTTPFSYSESDWAHIRRMYSMRYRERRYPMPGTPDADQRAREMPENAEVEE